MQQHKETFPAHFGKKSPSIRNDHIQKPHEESSLFFHSQSSGGEVITPLLVQLLVEKKANKCWEIDQESLELLVEQRRQSVTKGICQFVGCHGDQGKTLQVNGVKMSTHRYHQETSPVD